MMTRPLAISLSLILLAACQAGPPSRGKVTPLGSPRMTGSRAPGPAATATAPGAAGELRPVGPGGVQVALTGKVKLLSNNGAGIVSNNGGGVIANNGGGVLSNNGAGLISDKGAAYALAQAAPPAEALLADAAIEVLDARGRVLADAEGRPVGGTTDRAGAYAFTAMLPDENLVLRIRLWNGGELAALLTRGTRALDLDTASTLGAAYVLAEYVKGDQAVLDRLPAKEAGELRTELDAARARLAGPPAYRPDEMARATAALRAEVPTVDAALERIEAILLLGQKALGAGRQATEVSLTSPKAVYRDAKGNTYVAEGIGRIRRVAPDGTIHLYAGLGGASETGVADLGELDGMTGTPDGTLYLADIAGRQVRRLAPDGTLTTMVGGGTNETGGGPATGVRLFGSLSIAIAPDGTLYVKDFAGGSGRGPRLLRVKDGRAEVLPCPGAACAEVDVDDLRVAPDGRLWAMAMGPGEDPDPTDNVNHYTIWRWAPEGGWVRGSERFAQVEDYASIVPTGPDAFFRFDAYHVIRSVAGVETTVVGSGDRSRPWAPGMGATEGHFETIHQVWAGADGAILFVDANTRCVYEVAPAGQVRRVAGEAGTAEVRLDRGLSLNGPLGVAFDGSGRLLVSETDAQRIRRVDGDRLVPVVGPGPRWEDGPVLDAAVANPGAIAAHDGHVYYLEWGWAQLRRVTPAGLVETVAGVNRSLHPDDPPNREGRSFVARDFTFARPMGLAIDAQGRPHVADPELNVVARVNGDGTLEILAGATSGDTRSRAGDEGDGGPASGARLSYPNGLAFDSKGNLYVADSFNCRIRKIAPDGTISTFAGLPAGETFAKLAAGPDVGEVAAASAAFAVPYALCIDAQDNLYVGELGTAFSGKLGAAGALFAGLPKLGASIRKITPGGRVTFVAGRAARVMAGGPDEDPLLSPGALAIDPAGNLVVADTGLNQVRLVPKAAL